MENGHIMPAVPVTGLVLFIRQPLKWCACRAKFPIHAHGSLCYAI